MVQPINYSIDIPDPTKAFLESFKVGSALVEQEQMQAQRQAAQAQQAQFQAGLNSFFAKPAADRTFEELQPLLIGANKQQFDALTAIGNNMNTERKEEAQKFAAKISFALRNNPEVASVMLQERIDATKDQNQKRILQIKLDKAIIDPIEAANEIEKLGAATFGKAWYDGILAANAERRLQDIAPSQLLEAQAKAKEAVAKALVAVETATDEISRAKALREYEQARARKERADANVAEATVNSRIAKTTQTTDPKKSSSDYEIISEEERLKLGLPEGRYQKNLKTNKIELLLKPSEPSEDERRTAGLLLQATNAYKNMLNAMYTSKGEITGAEIPGKAEAFFKGLPFKAGESAATYFSEENRQMFNQAASSLSEALLRAATGAGMNENEARQKIQEITPGFFDKRNTIKQKLDAIPKYLNSLETRAGRAIPPAYRIPKAPVTITLPNGKLATFPNPEAADAFKKKAGIQ